MIESGDETALIIAVRLPPALERLRQRGVRDASRGLPAHITLLYPFLGPSAIGAEVVASIRGVTDGVDAFTYRLVGRGIWPATLYATVEPERPFRSLYEALAAVFPSHPIYRGRFPFSPHVTIADGLGGGDHDVAADPAWSDLPVRRAARGADLLVRETDRWSVRHHLPFRTVGKSS
jgi:2'-5' RNA ligase